MVLSSTHLPLTVRHQRELAVLRTLAHLGCGRFAHLHELCFPSSVVSTVRMILADLTRSGYLLRSRWQLSAAGGRGHVWTITHRGLQYLAQHEVIPAALPFVDLGLPSTPEERSAWDARMALRSFLTQLVLDLRQYARVAWCAIEARDIVQPVPFGSTSSYPDALVSVVWEPPIMLAPDWLPWSPPAAPARPTVYAVYSLRQTTPDHLAQLMQRALQPPALPVLACQTLEQRTAVLTYLAAHPATRPVRIAVVTATESPVRGWRDGDNHPTTLQLTSAEERSSADAQALA